MGADVLRYLTFIAAGFYLGIAYVTVTAFNYPPWSALRRSHAAGIAAGTALLVLGAIGDIADRLGESMPWYGTPTVLAGLLLIEISMLRLYRASRNVPSHPPEGEGDADAGSE